MIHLALSIAAFLFLLWCACFVLIAVGWALLLVVGLAAQLVAWPVLTALEFVRNLTKR